MDGILAFWFPNQHDYQSYWFDRSKDEYIKETYTSLLNEMELQPFSSFLSFTVDEKMSLIILFDQFSRSIYRDLDNKDEKIEKNDVMARLLSANLISQGHDRKIPIIQRLFVLMPFRHQKKSDSLDYVMQKIEEYSLEINEDENRKLLDRFKMATLSSYTPLTDRILKNEYSEYSEEYDFSKYNEVLDPIYLTFKTRDNFDDVEKNPLYKTLLSFITERKIQTIGISLSGGVDSMVTMFLLKILQTTKKIENVYAMHLEYSNREESCIETQVISMYCDMINVPLYVRKIDYMRRDEVDRNFYEEETKKIRFHTYRYLNKNYGIQGWCLGHHHGDIAENVMMNLSNGRTLLDLAVMKVDCEMDNVRLYRPFLSHPKTDIYSFAYDYCVPYLKDTTPDWSCRGVLRRKVLPELKKQWPTIEQTLSHLADQSDEWNQTVNTFILEPIKKDISYDKEKKIINMEMKHEYKKLPYTIWLSLFLWMFHSIGVRMISRKNLTHFIDMLERNINKQQRFIFSNGCIGFFMKNKLRVIHIEK